MGDTPRRSSTSSEEVYDRLRGMILENRILPGERVNIDAVARDLGVSQTPVREAVRRLEGDQLLHKVAGKGYRTTPLLTLDQLRQLFEFRMMVDLWAVREVAVNRLSNPGHSLLAEVRRFARTSDGVTDIRQQLANHDTAFHGLVHAAVGNEWVSNAYAQTHCHVHTFRLYSPDIRGAVTIEEHTRIAQAVAAFDPDAAEAAMREHLTRAFHRFAEAFAHTDGQPAVGHTGGDRTTARADGQPRAGHTAEQPPGGPGLRTPDAAELLNR